MEGKRGVRAERRLKQVKNAFHMRCWEEVECGPTRCGVSRSWSITSSWGAGGSFGLRKVHRRLNTRLADARWSMTSPISQGQGPYRLAIARKSLKLGFRVIASILDRAMTLRLRIHRGHFLAETYLVCHQLLELDVRSLGNTERASTGHCKRARPLVFTLIQKWLVRRVKTVSMFK